MTKFYDWGKTLSYYNKKENQALLTMVVGGNGIGKTYGLRKWLVKRFIETGETFCEICRHGSSELPSISSGWFDKLEHNEEFKGYVFKVEACRGYIARGFDDNGEEIEKPDWQVCGYFVALSQFELVKRTTYVNVRTCVFDEFILDRSKPNCRYMRNEYSLLMKICVAVFREVPGDGIARRIIMMANAVDMVNPYFAECGIDHAPEYGFHWYAGKRILLHFVEPWDAEERKADTTIGLLTSGHKEQEQMFDNVLFGSGNAYIAKKPSNAACIYNVVFQDCRFGVWRNSKAEFFISSKMVDDKVTFALTTSDNSIDYVMARKTEPMLKALCEVFYCGRLYYESPMLRGQFEKVLLYFGIR